MAMKTRPTRNGIGWCSMEDGRYLSGVPGKWSCPERFWFEGDQLYVKDLAVYCCPRAQFGIYDVQGVPQDYLNITVVSDECGARESLQGDVGMGRIAVDVCRARIAGICLQFL